MTRKMKKGQHQEQRDNAIRHIRRVKQEAKNYIWALPPEEAKREAVLLPPPSELRRLPARAWK
jgi:hypothetical protein